MNHIMSIVQVVIILAVILAVCALIRFQTTWYPHPPKPQKGRKVLACVGDSITFGAGVRNRRKDSYPACLQKEIGESWQVINYGMSGRCATTNSNAPYTREKNYKRTFTDNPEMYLVMLGTNDSKPYNWDAQEFERDLAVLLGKYVKWVGSRNVIVLKPPTAHEVNGETAYDIQEKHILEELPIIDRIVGRLGIQALDLHEYTAGHPEWFVDGVHPNAEGNRAIASFIHARGLLRGI